MRLCVNNCPTSVLELAIRAGGDVNATDGRVLPIAAAVVCRPDSLAKVGLLLAQPSLDLDAWERGRGQTLEQFAVMHGNLAAAAMIADEVCGVDPGRWKPGVVLVN